MKFLKRSEIALANAICFFGLLALTPIVSAQDATLIFSVTGDIPYSSSEDGEMQQQIADHNLYSPSEFFVHIGDIKSGSGSCSESIYQKVRDYMLQLQVPAFITPGDNEWTDCSNPPQAWGFWTKYFLNFEQNFCGAPAAAKQAARPENFAWVQKGVLLIGITMPGGSEGSSDQTLRLQNNAAWATEQFQAHGAQVRAAVIFAHDMNESRDEIFFDAFGPVAASFGKPILYIHGSGHSWIQDFPLPQNNVMRVQVDNGGAALPVQITVTTNNPATFVFNQEPWDSNSQPINRTPCGQANTPAITVTPSPHNYGQIAVGSSSSQTFVVSNTGSADLVVTNTTLTGGNVAEFGIVSGGGSYILTPAQTRNVIVSFNPASQGAKSTTLRFESNDPDDGTEDISLTGTGTSNVPQFSLTANVVGAGSVTLNPAGGTYDAGTVVTVTAVPADGFLFSSWSGDLTGSTNQATVTMDANKNVTATFTPSDPGSGGTIVHQETMTGGSTGLTSVTSASLIGVSGHLYLAAISNRSNKIVTSVSGLGLAWTLVKAQCSTRGRLGLEVWKAQGTPSGNGVVTATFSATPDNAAIAVSRYSGVSAVNPVGNLISGNLNGVNGTCSGGSESNAYSFNLSTTANGAMVYGAISMRQETHTPGAGYIERVDLMQGSGSNAAAVAVEDKNFISPGTTVVNGSFSNSVYWAVIALELKPQSGAGPAQYTLTANASGSGSVSLNPLPTNGTYDAGATVQLTATPAAGFQFSGWSGDLSGSTSPATITMDGNKTITATFTAITVTQYTLTVNSVGSGSVSLNPPPTNGTYDAGATVELTATPAAGFQFSGWSGDLSGSTNPATITMDGNKTVTATFTAIPVTQYTLTANPVGSGSVSLNPPPTNGTYSAGATVELTATPAAGFQFSGWSGDLSGSTSPATITMDGNKTVTATFTAVGGSGQIVYQETKTGASSSLTTVTTSTNLTAVSDDLYLAAIVSRSKKVVTGVSGLGLTWTLVKAQCSGRNLTGVEVWMARGIPQGGSDGTVTATFASAPGNAVIAVSRYSGVNAVNAIGNIISGNTLGLNGLCSGGSDNAAYSFNFTTTVGGAVIYGAAAIRSTTHAPGAGYTERIEIVQGSSSPATVAVQEKSMTTAGTVPLNGTFGNNNDWAVVGIELKP